MFKVLVAEERPQRPLCFHGNSQLFMLGRRPGWEMVVQGMGQLGVILASWLEG